MSETSSIVLPGPLVVPATRRPTGRRGFLRGLLAAGGTAALVPALVPAELAHLEEVVRDLLPHHVDMAVTVDPYEASDALPSWAMMMLGSAAAFLYPVARRVPLTRFLSLPEAGTQT